MKCKQKYLSALEPLNVLGLLPRAALEHMLIGFSHKLSCGVTLLYPKKWPVSLDTIGRLDPVDQSGGPAIAMTPLCAVYRKDSECLSRCHRCDNEVALKYFHGQCNQPQCHRCHLKIWDMCYPLVVDERACGVLFAGQDIGTTTSELDEVQHAIRQRTPKHHLDAVQAAFDRCREDKTRISRKDTLYAEFREFGEMVQSLVESAYRRAFDASFHEFLVDAGVDLTATRGRDATQWWMVVAEAADIFRSFTHLESVLVLFRREGRYELKATDKGPVDGRALRFPSHVFAGLEDDCLMPLPKEVRGKVRSYLRNDADVRDYVFKRDLKGHRHLGISTVLVLTGEIRLSRADAVEDFCRLVSLRADVTGLVERIERDSEAERARVRDVLHHTKNPLQKINLWADNDSAFEAPNIRNTRARIVNELQFVKIYLRSLYATMGHKGETVDLQALVAEVMDGFQPKVAKKNCCFTWTASQSPVPVYADFIEIRTVVDNLIDNAVKYSWYGSPDRLEPVHISLRTQGAYAELNVRNYGIGIPPDVLKRLHEAGEGIRARVPDKGAAKKWGDQRPGSGLGIPISRRILSKYGGTLEIISRPADPYPRDPAEKYHRFITSVSMTLPLDEGQHG